MFDGGDGGVGDGGVVAQLRPHSYPLTQHELTGIVGIDPQLAAAIGHLFDGPAVTVGHIADAPQHRLAV